MITIITHLYQCVNESNTNNSAIIYFISDRDDLKHDPFEGQVAGWNLVAMAITGILFLLITILCELNFFRKPR